MHEHVWLPLQGEAGRYTCSCGCHGRRELVTGSIVQAAPPHRETLNVRPIAYEAFDEHQPPWWRDATYFEEP